MNIAEILNTAAGVALGIVVTAAANAVFDGLRFQYQLYQRWRKEDSQ